MPRWQKSVRVLKILKLKLEIFDLVQSLKARSLRGSC